MLRRCLPFPRPFTEDVIDQPRADPRSRSFSTSTRAALQDCLRQAHGGAGAPVAGRRPRPCCSAWWTHATFVEKVWFDEAMDLPVAGRDGHPGDARRVLRPRRRGAAPIATRPARRTARRAQASRRATASLGTWTTYVRGNRRRPSPAALGLLPHAARDGPALRPRRHPGRASACRVVMGETPGMCPGVLVGGWGPGAGPALEGAEELAQGGAAQVAGLLHDAGRLGVGGEGGPPLLVPVEDRPDTVLLDRVAVDHRALAAVRDALVGALGAVDLQEVVEVLHRRRGQDHRSFSLCCGDGIPGSQPWWPARRESCAATGVRHMGGSPHFGSPCSALTAGGGQPSSSSGGPRTPWSRAQRVAAARLVTPSLV